MILAVLQSIRYITKKKRELVKPLMKQDRQINTVELKVQPLTKYPILTLSRYKQQKKKPNPALAPVLAAIW